MSLQIRCEPLESHQSDLIALLKRHLTPNSDQERFDWLYKQNPNGPARVWLARETGTGELVGAAAAFRRQFHFRGEITSGWVLGDFCLTKNYRTLGPAVQLQRTCVEAVTSNGDFCYDFPSNAMMAVYKRLGVQQTTRLVRWAKPLRIEDKLEGIVRSKRAARFLASFGNPILRARGWKGTDSVCEIQLNQGPCGEEFTALDKSLGSGAGLRSERTATYLNWRYLANPHKRHSMLVARKKGALVGYVVTNDQPDDARLVDLLALEQPALVARLIAAGVHALALRGAKTVSLVASQSHSWSKLFERAGFRPRESSPIVAITRGAKIGDADFQANCCLTEGDRDS